MQDTDAQPFITPLGTAAIEIWPSLPQDAQRLLFEAAVQGSEKRGDAAFRESLATFLHQRHPRTAG